MKSVGKYLTGIMAWTAFVHVSCAWLHDNHQECEKQCTEKATAIIPDSCSTILRVKSPTLLFSSQCINDIYIVVVCDIDDNMETHWTDTIKTGQSKCECSVYITEKDRKDPGLGNGPTGRPGNDFNVSKLAYLHERRLGDRKCSFAKVKIKPQTCTVKRHQPFALKESNADQHFNIFVTSQTQNGVDLLVSVKVQEETVETYTCSKINHETKATTGKNTQSTTETKATTGKNTQSTTEKGTTTEKIIQSTTGGTARKSEDVQNTTNGLELPIPKKDSDTNSEIGGPIVLAIVIPLVGLIVALSVAVCYLWRKRQGGSKHENFCKCSSETSDHEAVELANLGHTCNPLQNECDEGDYATINPDDIHVSKPHSSKNSNAVRELDDDGDYSKITFKKSTVVTLEENYLRLGKVQSSEAGADEQQNTPALHVHNRSAVDQDSLKVQISSTNEQSAESQSSDEKTYFILEKEAERTEESHVPTQMPKISDTASPDQTVCTHQSDCLTVEKAGSRPQSEPALTNPHEQHDYFILEKNNIPSATAPLTTALQSVHKTEGPLPEHGDINEYYTISTKLRKDGESGPDEENEHLYGQLGTDPNTSGHYDGKVTDTQGNDRVVEVSEPAYFVLEKHEKKLE